MITSFTPAGDVGEDVLMCGFNPLEHPVVLGYPARVPASVPAPWLEHVPFAMLLVDLAQPRILVELGTHFGVSYCAFCQAVKHLGLDTRCYAVDTWRGDPHSGYYGPGVLAELQAHHDPLYGGFSRLIQSTFEGALPHFAEGSVDVLHIDGYHTYDAVKNDFESWLPKMSDQGLIVFHDTNTREYDFGVWRFWDELKERYQHLEFFHNNGLGLIVTGTTAPPSIQALLDMPAEQLPHLRTLFYELGHRLSVRIERDTARQAVELLVAEREELARVLAAPVAQR